MTTLAEVRLANPGWFSRKNKRLFGDVSYRVLKGKESGKPYLVRSTCAWTDMFGLPKRLHWRINILNNDLSIGNLVDKVFNNLDHVKEWLKVA